MSIQIYFLDELMRSNFIIAIVLLMVLSGCKSPTEQEPRSSTALREFERIRLTDLKGQSINLAEHKGKTIFLNFWATWCKPCISEMPSIEAAQKMLKTENIVFLFASNESAEDIQQFISNNDYNFNYVCVENLEEMNVSALPTTFIFNHNGDLVFSEAGFREWNEKDNIDLLKKLAQK